MEREGSAKTFVYAFPRPAVTVDCVVLGIAGRDLSVLLIERDQPPFSGCWALPGGFVDVDEPLERAARRELREETGLEMLDLAQIGAYGDPGRDPRGHSVSVVFASLVMRREHQPLAASDARRVAWFAARRPPALAFDHRRILDDALDWLLHRTRCAPVGMELLPPVFRVKDLLEIYEALLGRRLDGERFHRGVLDSELLLEVGIEGTSTETTARLYRFDERRYRERQEHGLVAPFWG